MRARAVLALLVLTAPSCGRRSLPGEPTADWPFTAALPSGSYRLTVTMSTMGDDSSGANSSSSCYGIPDGIIGVSVPTSVQVDRAATAVVIRTVDPAATFRMDLQISGTAMFGTASGQYGVGPSIVRVDNGTPGSAAVATGAVLPSSVLVATGRITGTVDVGGIGCSNNGHSWTLSAALGGR